MFLSSIVNNRSSISLGRYLSNTTNVTSLPLDPPTLEQMHQSASAWFKQWGWEHDKFSDARWVIHRANAHIPLEAYRCRLLHRFGQTVAKKILVYLDLKYWINFRKVQLGQTVNEFYSKERSMLRELFQIDIKG